MEIPVTQIKNFSILSFIWKHIYLILFILFTLPIIISSISTAIETKNPTYPVVLLGTAVLNGDYALGETVQILKENPDSIVGMSKPNIGIYQHTKYYWLFFWNVIWRIIGFLFLISIPFVLFYKLFKLINNSTILKNVVLSVICSLTFIFIVNLLITIINLVNGITINLTNSNSFLNILQVIYLTIPFHGVISLLIYLFTLFQ